MNSGAEFTRGQSRPPVLRIVWDAISRRPEAMLSVAFLALVIIVAITAPVIAPYDPIRQDLRAQLALPSPSHWLGTDDSGRDIFSRLAWGARASLLAATQAVVIALLIGVPLGLLAGYFGGWVDEVIMRVADGVLSIPGLVMAITLVGIMGPGLQRAMIAIGIILSPSVCRLIRSQVLGVSRTPYVDSARILGFGHARILLRHVLPNAVQPVLVQTPILLATALLSESSLSFLGFGVEPPNPSWGHMLARANNSILTAGWQMFPPGFAISLTAVSFLLCAQVLRETLDPKFASQPRLKRGSNRAANTSRTSGSEHISGPAPQGHSEAKGCTCTGASTDG